MYYVSKSEEFVIENTCGDTFTILGKSDYVLNPNERIKVRRGQITLYKEFDEELDDTFVHMGCWPIAVEVDGKRYEHVNEGKQGGYVDPVPKITKLKAN